MTSSSPISSVVLSRYSGALVDLAEKAKLVDKVQNDLREIAAMVGGSDDLAHVITSPLVSQKKQSEIMSELAEKAKFQKLTKNFLGVLVANRRLDSLLGAIKAYDKIVSVRSGEVSIRVETAEPLTSTQEKAFQKTLATVIGADVCVETVVDPEILGGMIVTIGSYMVDDSVRRKLERLGAALKQGSNQNNFNQDSGQNLKEVV